jgi:hypothetical protein
MFADGFAWGPNEAIDDLLRMVVTDGPPVRGPRRLPPAHHD